MGRRAVALSVIGLLALGLVYLGWSGHARLPGTARVLLGGLAGVALLAVVALGGMARWVNRRGGFGVAASAVLRSVAAVGVGFGGWFLAVLVVAALWPALLAGWGPATVGAGIAAGLCVFLAWVRRDAAPGVRYGGLAAALAWGLAGAWLGGHALGGLAGSVTAILGAVLAANAAVLLLDVARARSRALPPRSGPAM
ncbi:hypothetical protein [Phytohabitans kaempferiae]|uniref:Major facilitator superfamily (MFS) profile domain-containing protein n=1 Tax=Phytohabitans kaempferiae TaxID=1620943 RepID=A0ABV6M9B3_9ACTN